MALVGLKGGGYVTAKRLEALGTTPEEVKNMTPDQQAQMMGWQQGKTKEVGTLEKVQEAVAKFDMTVEASPKGINIYNKKGEWAAEVINGKVIQKYKGSKNLFGSVVRDAVKAVL